MSTTPLDLLATAAERGDPRATTLLAAAGCVLQDRQASYDAPERNLLRIARIWSAQLADKLAPGATITPADVALLMVGMKLGRLMFNPTHQDSIVDVLGYGACLAAVTAVATNATERRVPSYKDGTRLVRTSVPEQPELERLLGRAKGDAA